MVENNEVEEDEEKKLGWMNTTQNENYFSQRQINNTDLKGQFCTIGFEPCIYKVQKKQMKLAAQQFLQWMIGHTSIIGLFSYIVIISLENAR